MCQHLGLLKLLSEVFESVELFLLCIDSVLAVLELHAERFLGLLQLTRCQIQRHYCMLCAGLTSSALDTSSLAISSFCVLANSAFSLANRFISALLSSAV